MDQTRSGATSDMITALLQAAVQAPSSHNTQPWVFLVRDGGIDLLADRTRALPANDPDDRELTISCGCALFNLRVAAARAAVPLDVHLMPGGYHGDQLAAVELSASGTVPPGLAELADAVSRRRTFRRTFSDRPVAVQDVAALVNAAYQEQAWLEPLDSADTRHAAADLVAEGDASQWANPSWRRELAAWMHPRRGGDGLTVPGLTLPLAQGVVRTFDIGLGVGAKDRQIASASPLLVALGTEADGPEQWLVAGQALQRMLLVACGLGLQASFLNQPVQVAALRFKLQHLLGRPGYPQLLLRLGYAEDQLPASPRRPLTDVVEHA